MLRLLSRIVLKTVVRALLSMVYGVEMRGEENLKLAGERRVVVANHQSFLDGLVLAAFLPGDPVFAVDTGIAKRWWVKPLLSLVDLAPVDPANPMALKRWRERSRRAERWSSSRKAGSPSRGPL
jgi:acyl-[acyl-carrier-protein]-phospholipid O-acyltransferase / long-chain-fatty-acid--[acyl-carrier-protein] ligase